MNQRILYVFKLKLHLTLYHMNQFFATIFPNTLRWQSETLADLKSMNPNIDQVIYLNDALLNQVFTCTVQDFGFCERVLRQQYMFLSEWPVSHRAKQYKAYLHVIQSIMMLRLTVAKLLAQSMPAELLEN